MTDLATLPSGATLPAAEVLERSGSNFRTAFGCMDPERRSGMTAIYAFCRVADDAADDTPDPATGRSHIAFWRDELHAAGAGNAKTPVGQALGTTITRFGTAVEDLDALLDGVSMDLEPQGFADEPALRQYCDCVASAVGRACLPVFGVRGDVAIRYANALGQALQFTNILRDLRTDAQVERVYAPRSWLDESGVDAAWLHDGGPESVRGVDGPIAALQSRFVATARDEFAIARHALAELSLSERRAMVPARIMGAVYGSLLQRLSQRLGRLDAERVRVPRPIKLWWAAMVFAGIRS
ncbi:MAG: squalene/phytoene synthase family protein [bacterium]|nr:squalene/phytoene synthase family protein [bacterium]